LFLGLTASWHNDRLALDGQGLDLSDVFVALANGTVQFTVLFNALREFSLFYAINWKK